MSSIAREQVRVGRVKVPLGTAATWVVEYTDAAANLLSDRPYAFPAYDRYDGGSTDPGTLTDGDLLAPVLLNARVTARSFYGLQRFRGRLEEGLRNPALDGPLAATDPDKVAAAVRALYGVLDDTTRPWGVEGTTLSKILHRKRPHSLVLYDRWVRSCYVGEDAPVALAQRRSWADYMVLVTDAIRHDIASQPEVFARLRHAEGEELSDVRLLDILAWRSKGGSPNDDLEDLTGETSGDPRE